MIRAKYRIRFAKSGDLRLVSHHDLMRCFERMMRRGRLPMRMTEGFNPRPKMVFAQSLALGIVGLDELCDLELSEELLPEVVESKLVEQSPPGLTIHSVARVGASDKLRVVRLTYRLPLPSPDPDVAERIEDLLKSDHCHVERTRPTPRRVDVRPFVEDVRLEAGCLEMTFAVSPDGTARPEDVVRALGLGSVLDDGGILERTKVELADEASLVPRAARPAADEDAEREARPEPIVQGPLSFDS